MTSLSLEKLRFQNGLWEGLVENSATGSEPPRIEARYRDRTLADISLTEAEDQTRWHLSLPIPTEALGDGVHCILIVDAASGEKLADFTLIAGEPLADDLRAEVELLRAELDMLKRAFRRHCRDTQ